MTERFAPTDAAQVLDVVTWAAAEETAVEVIGAGEVFLVEDTIGKGHMSKAVDGKLRHCIFVPID